MTLGVWVYNLRIMNRDNKEFSEGTISHIYNRGNGKEKIFLDEQDYKAFLFRIAIAVGFDQKEISSVDMFNLPYSRIRIGQVKKGSFKIHAFCLMPNHFHILLTPCVDNGVSKFMQKLSTGYSMYFNKRYNRTGTLFEGAFKSKWSDHDTYLKYLYAYIHLNPLKLWGRVDVTSEPSIEETLDFLKSYAYSSLPDYLKVTRAENVIIDPALFPVYFQTASDHINELQDWLTYKEENSA